MKHTSTSTSDIETEIIFLLKTKKKDFLTVIQIRNALPGYALKALALTRQSSLSDVVSGLMPYLKKQLKLFKSSANTYIGFDKPLKEIILNAITLTPGLTSKQLNKKIPVPDREFIHCINELFEKGKIRCTLNSTHNPRLTVSPKFPFDPEKENFIDHAKPVDHQSDTFNHVQLADQTTDAAINKKQTAKETEEQPGEKTDIITEQDRNAFKAAYNAVGKGKSFVRIHRIRNYLNWCDNRFNSVLSELIYDYSVQLHGGDPSKLTEKEINSSFTDEYRTLYITLTWRSK